MAIIALPQPRIKYHPEAVKLNLWALWLCRSAIGLALVVVWLGGWTRLNDAGLSCPDWPGCYGELFLPSDTLAQQQAQARYPELPLDLSRGWLEMNHRYLAGSLGLLIAGLGVIAIRLRRQPNYPVTLSLALLILVVVQALFGMWTVTLKLLPQIVTLHLIGGLLTLGLLWHLHHRLSKPGLPRPRGSLASVVLLCLLLLFGQIGLGGWTSANYAGWSCSHWLQCERNTVVELDFERGFSLPELDGRNYLGGQLPREARAAIQVSHRLMALLLTMALLGLCMTLYRRGRVGAAAGLSGLLGVQLLLGVLIVQLGLPLGLAFLHHAGAALLLLALIQIYHGEEVLNG